MAKKVTFGSEAKNKMLVGFDTVADAVGGTLGPKGLNAFIQDGIYPKITNDGATISAHIELKDPIENLGAGVVRNTSGQTNDDVGDGTTTTTVILQSIVHECLKRPENPMEIRGSLKEAGNKVIEKLKKKSIKIDKKDIKKVALISSENEQIATIISDIFNKIGEKSVINVEDSRTFETNYEVVEGYEANVGFMSPAFITDTKKARAVLENVPVLVTEKRISSIADIQPLFEKFEANKISQCVIVCDDIDNSMLGVLIANKSLGRFNSLVIKAQSSLLEDIEAVVGATRVSDTTGVSFQNIELENLGRAEKVISQSNKTLFIGNNKSAKLHANHLETLAAQEKNSYVQKKILDRVSKLRGGIAILRIAAPSDYDREYLKFKAEDTIKAVKAAVEEGIVEGGGMALWNIANEMKPKNIGEEILKKALQAPLRKIIENAGKDYAEIVNQFKEKDDGYDAKNDKIVKMIDSGIIDPTKVERCSVQNAISAASALITSFVTITDEVEENK